VTAENAQQGRDQHEPDERRVEQDGEAEMTPISFGGSGPERANVKKTATITAAAAKITLPEWAIPPTAASFGSCERSQCSFAEERRNTV
jgi:hypothetical protein